MRIALFTDIHANREALTACLEHAERSGIARYIFLGDYVGYGADPGWAVDTVMRQVERGAVALAGNHDAAIAGDTAGMNDLAAEAIEWTRPRLDPKQREFLARLPLTFSDGTRLFVHASAHEPEQWEYIANLRAAWSSLMATTAQATFCGHVHVPALYHLSATGKLASFDPIESVEMPLLAQHRWVAVIGAVGQPRDRNPAACYAVLDDVRNGLTYVRVPYDAETAARKIRQAGLPIFLGDRLIDGV